MCTLSLGWLPFDLLKPGCANSGGFGARWCTVMPKWIPEKNGHFLRGRSLKGRCNICVYVPVCVCVCVCSCVCPSSPPWPRPYCGTEQQNPSPHPPKTPHPRSRIRTRNCAIAWPTPGKNYPLKSAWNADHGLSFSFHWQTQNEFWSEFCSDHGLSLVPRS